MYRIIDKRSSGKTSRLLLLAKEHNGIIVCQNPDKMMKRAHTLGLTGIQYLSYGEFTQKIFENVEYDKPIFIDDLELYLRIYEPNIAGYTISED